jgi:hypothetical protein
MKVVTIAQIVTLARPPAQESAMTGRLLVAGIVSVLLLPAAQAQQLPVPPPAGKVAQVDAQEFLPGTEQPPPSQIIPYHYQPLPSAVPPPQLPPAVPPPSYEGQSWVAADALLWFLQGARVPALLTTSPPGTPAGVAGLPGPKTTTVLFGWRDVNTEGRLGGLLRAGTWLDQNHCYGVEAYGLLTQPQGTSFGVAGLNGVPILARPFLDAKTGKQAADAVAVPGVISGSFFGSYSTSGLYGGGLLFRENIANSRNPYNTCSLCNLCEACGCDPQSPRSFRVDTLLGYRYLGLEDHLDALTTTTNLAGGANGPAGTVIRRIDSIQAHNSFNGVDLGFDGEFRYGSFYLDALLKTAIGATSSSVGMFGAHTVNGVQQPGGGFLVQGSNAGRFTKTTGAVLPQLGLNFGYRVNDQLRVYAGYTLLYWFHVARAGDALEPNLNPNFLNGGEIGKGAAHPVFQYNESNIWVQGANLGVEWRY